MKVLLHCTHCLRKDGLRGFQPVVVHINNERLFKMTCPQGHETLTIIQQPKYEVLFELGMNALADAYPREAVTSFASSLESYYEFCIKGVLKLQDVDQAVLDTSWREMSKQSERQLGAFILLWVNIFGVVPKLLSNDSRNFRNRVVHQGYIPRPEEAIEFGEKVVDCIRANLQDMEEKFGERLQEIFYSAYLGRLAPHEEQVTTLMSIPATIDWSRMLKQDEAIDLHARIDQIKKEAVLYQWPKD